MESSVIRKPHLYHLIVGGLCLLLGAPQLSAVADKKSEPKEKKEAPAPKETAVKSHDTPARATGGGHDRAEAPARAGAGRERPEPAGRAGARERATATRGNTAQPGAAQGRVRPGAPGQPAAPASGPGARRPGPNGTVVTSTRGGGEVVRSSRGVVREVHVAPGKTILHTPDGGRRIEVKRPDGRIIVTSAHGGHGYSQRPIIVGGRTYVSRTYVVGGMVHARAYRPYMVGGRTFYRYTPSRYYRTSYYRGFYRPWARPYAYGWGWRRDPWYGYYGGYFSPMPVYASPAFWMADFIIAATLRDAYQARMEANVANAGAPMTGGQPMSPEVRQLVADEVAKQIAEHEAMQRQAAAKTSAPEPDGAAWFSGTYPRIFVASAPVTGMANDVDCPINAGDVLRVNAPPAPDAKVAQVEVLASAGQSCPTGRSVTVGVEDLIEMQNSMRASLDTGLTEFQAQSKGGKDGLPVLAKESMGATDSELASQVVPDPNATFDMVEQAQAMGQAEQAALEPEPAPEPEPVVNPVEASIVIGMREEELRARLGPPRATETYLFGSVKILTYQDREFTLIGGQIKHIR